MSASYLLFFGNYINHYINPIIQLPLAVLIQIGILILSLSYISCYLINQLIIIVLSEWHADQLTGVFESEIWFIRIVLAFWYTKPIANLYLNWIIEITVILLILFILLVLIDLYYLNWYIPPLWLRISVPIKLFLFLLIPLISFVTVFGLLWFIISAQLYLGYPPRANTVATELQFDNRICSIDRMDQTVFEKLAYQRLSLTKSDADPDPAADLELMYPFQFGGHLPFLNQFNYIDNLIHFTESYQSNILVIYGPKSTGKTHGLSLLYSNLKKQNRLVICIDIIYFLSNYQHHDYYHLMNYFRNEFERALSSIQLTINERYQFIECLKGINGTAYQEAANIYYHPGAYRRYRYISPDLVRRFTLINTALATMAGSISRSESIQLPQLFQYLELLASIRPELSPVIIFRELQRITESEFGSDAEKFLSEFKQSIEYRKMGKTLIHIIVETSNYFFINKLFNIKHQYINDLFMNWIIVSMNRTAVYNQIVDKYKIFNSNEFNLIWSIIGGHGGSWASIYYDYRFSHSVEESLYTLETMTIMQVKMAIDYSTDPIRTREFLSILANSNSSTELEAESCLNNNIINLPDDIIQLTTEVYNLCIIYPPSQCSLDFLGLNYSSVIRYLINSNILFAVHPYCLILPQNQITAKVIVGQQW